MARKELKAKKAAEKKARQERMAQIKHTRDSLSNDSIKRGSEDYLRSGDSPESQERQHSEGKGTS